METQQTGSAEDWKNKGNQSFKACHFEEALDYYSKAINLQPTAIFYANRAVTHMRLESYGAALSDAEEAIKLDPQYGKGYYRRGAAHLALGKYKLALQDFKKVIQLVPSDNLAKMKLKACLKEIRRIEFEKAIETEITKLPSETIDLKKMIVESSYDGINLKDGEELTLDFIKDMIDRFKELKKIHYKYACLVLLKCLEIFKKLPSLYHVQVPDDGYITVCGDTHGQFFDLINIFKLNGLPSKENPYLFNGDYVDRGSFSCEVILTLLAFKAFCPESIHLTRGNHESKHLNRIYGFEGEVKAKYDQQLYELFQEVFNVLPLCVVINKKVMVVHGGLFSQDGVKLSDIEKIDRNRDIPDSGLMADMLWSDPQKENGRSPNKRGISISFGPDVTQKFLQDNNLELLVRSHEVKHEGYEIEADGSLITVFSAPNYCDQVGNKGAFIKFNGLSMKPEITVFEAVPHPPVKPMQYVNRALFE